MSGVIENAASADARFMGSENVMMMRGVVFVPVPRGADDRTYGRVVSTVVQVSFVAGPLSTLPARSVAIERNANRCPSTPSPNEPVMAAVAIAPGTPVHAPPLSLYCTVYVTMSVVPAKGPQVRVHVVAVSYIGSNATPESGAGTSPVR